jgi:hypothetical protein
MEKPTVPTWFRKKLKEFDSSLRVEFNTNTGKWDIQEPYKKVIYCGEWEGEKIYELRTFWSTIFGMPQLGSRIFTWLKEVKRNRFNGYRDMMEKLKLQGYEKLYNEVSTVK